MHHEASQRDPLAAFFATPRVVDLSFPGIASYPTVYVWCVLDLWEALPLPDAAELPQRQACLRLCTCGGGDPVYCGMLGLSCSCSSAPTPRTHFPSSILSPSSVIVHTLGKHTCGMSTTQSQSGTHLPEKGCSE